MAPLTGIAFASNWLINKLNLNSHSVKTTKMTTFSESSNLVSIFWAFFLIKLLDEYYVI